MILPVPEATGRQAAVEVVTVAALAVTQAEGSAVSKLVAAVIAVPAR